MNATPHQPAGRLQLNPKLQPTEDARAAEPAVDQGAPGEDARAAEPAEPEADEADGKEANENR